MRRERPVPGARSITGRASPMMRKAVIPGSRLSRSGVCDERNDGFPGTILPAPCKGFRIKQATSLKNCRICDAKHLPNRAPLIAWSTIHRTKEPARAPQVKGDFEWHPVRPPRALQLRSPYSKLPRPAHRTAVAVVVAVAILRIPSNFPEPGRRAYDPTGHWWLSTILASLPVIVLLGTLADL